MPKGADTIVRADEELQAVSDQWFAVDPIAA
jgi:hypothetical protein